MSVLAHVRAGSGPRPLLLLHGFLGSARNLAALARRLADRAPALSVVAPDLTGHGASPPLPPGADLGTLAGDVLETAAALGLARPLDVVGHSLGGRVALRAGLAAPPALGRVTLLDIGPAPIAPGATGTTRVVDALLAAPASAPSRGAFRDRLSAAGLEAGIVEWLLTNLVHEGQGYRWRIDRAALADLHARTNAEDLWPAVEGRRPYAVRCIRGALSGYVDDREAARLEAAGCPVTTLAGAGHFLHVDRPAELLDALLVDLA